MEEYRISDQTDIGWVALKVANRDRALSFYQDVVGLQPRDLPFSPAGPEGRPSIGLSVTGAPPYILFLIVQPDARPKPPRTTGLYHTAIRFPSRLALGQALQRMVLQQYPLGGVSDHGVSEALYATDPDGNGVELYADRPREQWVIEGGQVVMSLENLDVNALLRLAGGTKAGQAAPEGTVIGHVHLQVSDLQRSKAFYHDLLGLDVTQENFPGALFLSAGGYHHHLAVNVWAGRGAPPPPADTLGLEAFSLQLPDLHSWQLEAKRVEEAGFALERRELAGIGDLALFHDPDGIGVSLGIRQAEWAAAGLSASSPDRAHR
jgi:catechol 2,3-dioxygenase